MGNTNKSSNNNKSLASWNTIKSKSKSIQINNNNNNSNGWNSIQPIELLRLIAQYCSLKEKSILYSINHYWFTAINHPIAWISNPYNEWNSSNNTLFYKPKYHLEFHLISSLEYITIMEFPYITNSNSFNYIDINNRSIVYNTMKYLKVLIINTDSNYQLESIDYELIGEQLSNSLIRLELINNKILTILSSNNLKSLSKLSKLKIFIIKSYNIELSGLYYINELTELTNLGLDGCCGYNELSPNGRLLLSDNTIIPTMNRLLYLNLYSTKIESNPFISICNNNSSSNLLVLKLAHFYHYHNSELLLSISLLNNLTILDLSECIRLNDNILYHIGNKCKLLKRLNLSSCQIPDPILSIGEFTNLERLDLERNNVAVTDTVLLIISQKLLKLKYLNLGSIDNYSIIGLNNLTILIENYNLIELLITTDSIESINLLDSELLSNSIKSIIITYNNRSSSSRSIDFSWNYIKIPYI